MTAAEGGSARGLVAVLFLLAVSSCYATTSDSWLIPQVLVQPGSSVVVISNSKLRAVVHPDRGMFGGAASTGGVDLTPLEWSFQTLDVKTCKAGSVRTFKQSVDVVGWGTAAGELWVRSPDNASTIRSLDGVAQLEIGTARAPSQGEPLPVRSGVAGAPGLLRVWDLGTRSVRDLSWSSELPFTRIFSARPGDDTLVGLVRAKDGKSIDVLAVPVSDSSSPSVTTTFNGRHSPERTRLLRRGTWLALAPDTTIRDATLDLVDVRAGKLLARYPLGFGESWTLVDGEHPRLARLVDPRSCRKLEIVDLDTGARTDVPLPGCAIGVLPWGQDSSFVVTGVESVGKVAVDVRTGTTARLGVASSEGDLVGSAFYDFDRIRPDELVAVEPSSGKRWTAATGFGRIRSAVGVPVARRVVVVNERRRVLTFDVDARQVRTCH